MCTNKHRYKPFNTRYHIAGNVSPAKDRLYEAALFLLVGMIVLYYLTFSIFFGMKLFRKSENPSNFENNVFELGAAGSEYAQSAALKRTKGY